MKIPIPSTTQIARISQTLLTSIDAFTSLLKNITVEMVEGVPRASRRKGIEVLTNLDASAEAISPTFGRGIHWSQSSASTATYISNYNTIYLSTYLVSIGTFGAGVAQQQRTKSFFASVQDGTYDTVVIDVPTNAAAAMETGVPTFTSISGVTPSPLNAGAVWLNGRLFVCSQDRIYNSDLNDVTAGYVDFVTAERESDLIKGIVKHHDHIVSLGVTTTEFFYHDENPGATGSPLRRRQDVYYNIGLMDINAFDESNDVIYFLGFGDREGIGLYRIKSFQLEKISDARFDRWIRDNRSPTAAGNTLVCVPYEGRTLVTITHYDDAAAQADFSDHLFTFVFEEDGRNYVWDTNGIDELAHFPVIGACAIDGRVAGGGSAAEGSETSSRLIMANGDVVKFRDRYDEPDTFKDDLGTEGGFTATIEFNDFDGDTTAWKFCHSVEPYGDYEAACEFNLSWKDEDKAYNTPRTLTKANRQRAVSCGRFSRRKFRLTSIDNSATVDEHMELEGLDANVEMGSY